MSTGEGVRGGPLKILTIRLRPIQLRISGLEHPGLRKSGSNADSLRKFPSDNLASLAMDARDNPDKREHVRYARGSKCKKWCLSNREIQYSRFLDITLLIIDTKRGRNLFVTYYDWITGH